MARPRIGTARVALVGVTADQLAADAILQRVEAAQDAPLAERVDVYEAALNDLEAMLAKAMPR
ncbi:MAG: hypothetical protein LBS27_11190 [Bifidobacteriaceae bacterium]|nr:hypothetical protein [Bifidobacteriaceae bacterium]